MVVDRDHGHAVGDAVWFKVGNVEAIREGVAKIESVDRAVSDAIGACRGAAHRPIARLRSRELGQFTGGVVEVSCPDDHGVMLHGCSSSMAWSVTHQLRTGNIQSSVNAYRWRGCGAKSSRTRLLELLLRVPVADIDDHTGSAAMVWRYRFSWLPGGGGHRCLKSGYRARASRNHQNRTGRCSEGGWFGSVGESKRSLAGA